MCERCDNFDEHMEFVQKVNKLCMEYRGPFDEVICALLYMCGVLSAAPTDGLERKGTYQPNTEEGWLKEAAISNITSAYSRVERYENFMRMRKGGLN